MVRCDVWGKVVARAQERSSASVGVKALGKGYVTITGERARTGERHRSRASVKSKQGQEKGSK